MCQWPQSIDRYTQTHTHTQPCNEVKQIYKLTTNGRNEIKLIQDPLYVASGYRITATTSSQHIRDELAGCETNAKNENNGVSHWFAEQTQWHIFEVRAKKHTLSGYLLALLWWRGELGCKEFRRHWQSIWCVCSVRLLILITVSPCPFNPSILEWNFNFGVYCVGRPTTTFKWARNLPTPREVYTSALSLSTTITQRLGSSFRSNWLAQLCVPDGRQTQTTQYRWRMGGKTWRKKGSESDEKLNRNMCDRRVESGGAQTELNAQYVWIYCVICDWRMISNFAASTTAQTV